MLKVSQAIIVEGKYDVNTVKQVVSAPVFSTSGFGIMHNTELLELLRKIAEKRGLIILTDSDGAGFVIRNFLKGALPKGCVYQAYIPDIYGKEKRKTVPGKEGKLGVEGMTPAVIESAISASGALNIASSADNTEPPITKADLYSCGLSGCKDSAAKRVAFLSRQSLPEHLSPNALLDTLNILYTRSEFLNLVRETEND